MGNRRASFKITAQDVKMLKAIAHSRTEGASRVQRAKIFLLYDSGVRITVIMCQLDRVTF